MLPKNKRITKELFQSILKTGRTLSSPLFLFRYMSIPGMDTKYAFVVPKSVSKQAVKRNKLRRQGYNTLRTLPLPLVSGIFFYKKGSEKTNLNEIKENVNTILKKIHP